MNLQCILNLYERENCWPKQDLNWHLRDTGILKIIFGITLVVNRCKVNSSVRKIYIYKNMIHYELCMMHYTVHYALYIYHIHYIYMCIIKVGEMRIFATSKHSLGYFRKE